MMYMPSIFGSDLMDDMMNEMNEIDNNFFAPRYFFTVPAMNMMKTDVTEKDGSYDVAVDLPGFKKEDVKVSLDHGYLKIEAAHNENNDQKDEQGKVVRKERYTGSCSRSYYVGDAVKQEDIHAKFEDGVLHLTVPAGKKQEALPETNTIAIEG